MDLITKQPDKRKPTSTLFYIYRLHQTLLNKLLAIITHKTVEHYCRECLDKYFTKLKKTHTLYKNRLNINLKSNDTGKLAGKL